MNSRKHAKISHLVASLPTSCVRTACPKLSTNLEQAVNNWEHKIFTGFAEFADLRFLLGYVSQCTDCREISLHELYYMTCEIVWIYHVYSANR
jgi:hypothetical protein